VDRLDQVPARLQFLFEYSAERALADGAARAEAMQSRAVLVALLAELEVAEPLTTKELFREVAARVRTATGQKGKALFHPIRLALTGEPEGMELDLAVPAIECGAALHETGLRPVASAAERTRAFLAALDAP